MYSCFVPYLLAKMYSRYFQLYYVTMTSSYLSPTGVQLKVKNYNELFT